MIEKHPYDLLEVLAEITYEAGHYRLRLDNNSRVKFETLIQWAKEFDQIHKDTDWNEVEYLDTIQDFIQKKLSQYLFPLPCVCSNCKHTSMRYEILEDLHLEMELRIICPECGIVYEGNKAEQFLFEKEVKVYKIKKLKPFLLKRKDEIIEKNAELEPYIDKDYWCETCGSKSGKCHPESSYCFICDSDNWRPHNHCNA